MLDDVLGWKPCAHGFVLSESLAPVGPIGKYPKLYWVGIVLTLVTGYSEGHLAYRSQSGSKLGDEARHGFLEFRSLLGRPSVRDIRDIIEHLLGGGIDRVAFARALQLLQDAKKILAAACHEISLVTRIASRKLLKG